LLNYFLETNDKYKIYKSCKDEVSDEIQSIANESSISLRETGSFHRDDIWNYGVHVNHLKIGGENTEYPSPSPEEIVLSGMYGYEVPRQQYGPILDCGAYIMVLLSFQDMFWF
jgi:hypothetical protein